jgi:hypothetical protein
MTAIFELSLEQIDSLFDVDHVDAGEETLTAP